MVRIFQTGTYIFYNLNVNVRKNPGSTLSLMRSIWPRIQLQPIFEALDAIVGASHTMSDYKDLMERPIEEDPLINPKT